MAHQKICIEFDGPTGTSEIEAWLHAEAAYDKIEGGYYFSNEYIDWPIEVDAVKVSQEELQSLFSPDDCEQIEAAIFAAADDSNYLDSV